MLIKVYDTEGVEHDMESVDARECCAEMGWSLTPKAEEVVAPAKPGRKSSVKDDE